MHRYTEYHILLKDKGFPQDLHVGDWVYLPDKQDYERIDGKSELPINYVYAPKLTTVVGALDKYSYTLKHVRIDVNQEMWILDADNIHIEDENINICLIRLWLEKNK